MADLLTVALIVVLFALLALVIRHLSDKPEWHVFFRHEDDERDRRENEIAANVERIRARMAAGRDRKR